MRKIPIEISARHIHLCKKDLEVLFGKGYQLKKMKKLIQSEEFAAKEKLDIQAPLEVTKTGRNHRGSKLLTGQVESRKIPNVRVMGPVRRETQVELSHTDGVFLRIELPVRESGYLKGTPGAILIGPKGRIKIKKGVINAWRHIHCSPKEAKKLGFKNRMSVSVKTKGICSITFHNVKVQVRRNYRFCMQLDTDEGNAACIIKRGEGVIIDS